MPNFYLTSQPEAVTVCFQYGSIEDHQFKTTEDLEAFNIRLRLILIEKDKKVRYSKKSDEAL